MKTKKEIKPMYSFRERPATFYSPESVEVVITMDDQLFERIKDSYQAHIEVSCTIIKKLLKDHIEKKVIQAKEEERKLILKTIKNTK